jgi:hypothetical protein
MPSTVNLLNTIKVWTTENELDIGVLNTVTKKDLHKIRKSTTVDSFNNEQQTSRKGY